MILSYVPLYVGTLVVFLAIDLVWLGVVARGLYAAQLGHLMADKVIWPVGMAFYALYVIGILIFAVLPAVDAGSLVRAAALGAAFGFFAYATYDLTNWATLKDWPSTIVFIDLAWGAVLTGTVATAGYLIATNLLGMGA
jgi:uncharacterized membrane protein